MQTIFEVDGKSFDCRYDYYAANHSLHLFSVNGESIDKLTLVLFNQIADQIHSKHWNDTPIADGNLE